MKLHKSTGSILLIGLIALGPQALAGEPTQETHAAEGIPIDYWGHLATIGIRINGQGPYEFIVDTGAGVTILEQRVAQELEIPLVGHSMIGSPMGAERIEADSLSIDELQIGEFRFEKQPALVMDLHAIFRSEDAPDGILSAASFEGLLFTIDFPGNEIRLRRGQLGPADGRSVLDYDGAAVVPHLPVSVAGVELDFALDTGAPGSFFVAVEHIAQLPLAKEPVVVGHGRTVDAEFEIKAAELDGAIWIGSLEFDRPSISFSDRSSQSHVGSKILREYVLTIDRSNRRLMLETSTAEPAAPTRRVVRLAGGTGYGIRLGGLSGDILDVLGVEAGLPAATAGLESGDRIVAMNGLLVASLSQEQRIGCLRGSPLVLGIERAGESIELTLAHD